MVLLNDGVSLIYGEKGNDETHKQMDWINKNHDECGNLDSEREVYYDFFSYVDISCYANDKQQSIEPQRLGKESGTRQGVDRSPWKGETEQIVMDRQEDELWNESIKSRRGLGRKYVRDSLN